MHPHRRTEDGQFVSQRFTVYICVLDAQSEMLFQRDGGFLAQVIDHRLGGIEKLVIFVESLP